MRPQIKSALQDKNATAVLSSLLAIAVHLFLIADLLLATRLHKLLGAPAQPVLLGTVWAVILGSAGALFLQRNGRAFLYFLVPALFLAYEVAAFAGGAPNPNAIFQFYAPLAFPPFLLFLSVHGGERLHKLIFRYSCAYAATYAALGFINAAGTLPADILTSIALSGDERGSRIFLHPAPIIYILVTALVRLRQALTFRMASVFALGCFDALLSQSRFFLACLLLTLMATQLRVRMVFVSSIAFGVCAAATVATVLNVTLLPWNPYEVFREDASGFVRMLSFDIATRFIHQFPILGVGIEGTPKALIDLTGYFLFFYSDLGMLGIMFSFGFVGLLWCFVTGYIACFVPGVPDKQSEPIYVLRNASCGLALQSAISPALWLTGAVPLAIALAYFSSARETHADASEPSDAPAEAH